MGAAGTTAWGQVCIYSWAFPLGTPEIPGAPNNSGSLTKEEEKSGCQGWATNDLTTLVCFLTRTEKKGTSEKSCLFYNWP